MTGRADSSVIPLVLLTLLAAYLFLDGVFVFLSALQLAVYAGFALLTAVAALYALVSLRLQPPQAAVLVLWLLLASAWLLPPLVAEYPYPRYVLTDFITMVLPVMLLVTGLRYPHLFLSTRSLFVLGVLLFAAALLAVPLSESAGRHEPPHALLTAMLWSVLLLSQSRATRRAAAVGIGLLILLAWNSGERTAVLLLLALGLAGRIMLMQRIRHAVLTIVGALLVVGGAIFVFRDVLILAAASTRLESLAQGELDTSLLNRLLEVRDVWKQWSIEVWFGFGHGATFTPELSYPPRNMTEQGRVHHVHFGPALLLYRYGVIGVFLYAWIIIDVVRYIMRMSRFGYRTPAARTAFFFTLALIGYLASFLAFNIIPDPAFSYTLAGYLFIRLTQPMPTLCVVVPRQAPTTAAPAAT